MVFYLDNAKHIFILGRNMDFLELRFHPCIDPNVVNNTGSTICYTWD
jgi:hypothetical protein